MAQSWRSDRRGSTARGYDSKWQRERLAFLESHPLCEYCQRRGHVRAATVVDHIVPHRGDPKIFWDRKGWQPLCAPCHNTTKAAEEGRHRKTGCDVNGRPLPGTNHHWHSGPYALSSSSAATTPPPTRLRRRGGPRGGPGGVP